jgi:uncharacterized protein YidB (DUF937 family)
MTVSLREEATGKVQIYAIRANRHLPLFLIEKELLTLLFCHGYLDHSETSSGNSIMDIRKLLELGASVIQQNSDKATTGIATDKLTSALAGILGGAGGNLDLGSLLSKMQAGGLGNIASSWLGKGANAPVSPDAVTDLLGADKVKAFASQLGLSEQSAKTAIADALPEMVDKASPDGSLLEGLVGNIGGMKGLTDIVGKLF